MAGGLNAHPNPFVEAWALKREHIEKTFRWTPKTLAIIALAGVAFPLWVYKTGVYEFVRSHAPRWLLPPAARARPALGRAAESAVANLNARAAALTLSRTRARRRRTTSG